MKRGLLFGLFVFLLIIPFGQAIYIEGHVSVRPTNVSIFVTGVPPPVVSPPGGGGGGRPPTVTELILINVTPDELHSVLFEGETRFYTLEVENLVNRDLLIDVYPQGEISQVISFDDIVELSPREKKIFEVYVGPAESPSFGKILFEYKGTVLEEVLVTLDIKSVEFLLDVTNTIPEDRRKVKAGKDFPSDIEIFQVADVRESVDLVVNYYIKDLGGDVFFEDSESFTLEGNRVEYLREFPSKGLSFGDYVLVVEVLYDDGKVATSSASFRVVGGIPWWVYLIAGIAIISYWIFFPVGCKREKRKCKRCLT